MISAHKHFKLLEGPYFEISLEGDVLRKVSIRISTTQWHHHQKQRLSRLCSSRAKSLPLPAQIEVCTYHYPCYV